MSQYNKTNLGALYGTSGSQFPNNTTGLITELIMRTFGQDVLDSFLSNVDDLQKKTTATGTNTYAITGGIAAYADGYSVFVKFTNASSGVSTLNVNAKGAKKIFVTATTQATTGDIPANSLKLLVYDSALDGAVGGFAMIGGSSGGGSQDLQSVLDQGGAALLTDDVTVTDDQTHTVAFGTTQTDAIGTFLAVADNLHLIGVDDVFLNFGTGGTGFAMTPTEMVFTDNDNSKGPGDAADYSANKTDLSYVTRKMLLDTVAGLKWKNSVRVSTAVAGTLATDFENGDTVDGVVLATGNRILIKNQAVQTENGIYTVNASGAPTRSTDADLAAELEGATVTVQEGTSNANTTWTQTTDGITLGVSNIVWAQFGTSVPDASETDKGIIEIATQAEVTTGIDDVRAITPLKFAAGVAARAPKVIQLACSDETTALTTGTLKITFRMPYAMTLTGVRASLTTAQASGSIFTVDINEAGSTILSTKLTIDNTEKTSTTAAAAAVISDSSLADDAEITIDIDQIGDGTAKGLKVTLIGS